MTAAAHGEHESKCALLLVALVLLAYAPSFGAGFLNYDDGWLVAENPLLAPDAWRTPLLAFTDFSRETRLILGAEYLPIRDLFGWLETRVFGVWAPGMHAVSVALYAFAALLFRGALLRCLGGGLGTELAAALFALHPVHAESVGWLAGQKDLLALCFVGGALYVHAGGRAHGRWSVPLLVLLASLSKSMSVAVLGLLVAQDLLLKRRPDWRLYAGSLASVALAMTAHVYVGGLVGMVAALTGRIALPRVDQHGTRVVALSRAVRGALEAQHRARCSGTYQLGPARLARHASSSWPRWLARVFLCGVASVGPPLSRSGSSCRWHRSARCSSPFRIT